jgi:hypothetical protein
MQKILAVWAQTTLEERQVYHRVTCLNSTDPKDRAKFQEIAMRMQQALTGKTEDFGGFARINRDAEGKVTVTKEEDALRHEAYRKN